MKKKTDNPFLGFLKGVGSLIKKYWIETILFILGFIIFFNFGFLKTLMVMVFSWILLIYLILKSSYMNSILRYILQIRETEDGQKRKKRKKVYEKEAMGNSHQVRRFNK